MDADFYFRTLYPLQDDESVKQVSRRVLRVCTDLGTGLYLTGGTAASRGCIGGSPGAEGPCRCLGILPDKGLSIDEALAGAQSKAAGLFPADVARVLLSAERTDWQLLADAASVEEDLRRHGAGASRRL